MSVNITQQGIVNASGNINANLLKDSYYTLTLQTDGSVSYQCTIPDISKIKNGVSLVISCDIELYNVKSMSRIGAEPSFTTSGSTNWIGVWTNNIANRKERIFAVHTMSGDATGVGQRGIYIQGVTFNSGGYIKVSNPKLEIGTYPTPWCPNINDDIYVGNICGFTELDNKYVADFSIGETYIHANEFIEW